MPLTDEQKKDALLAREMGASDYKIAKLLGVKHGMVRMFFDHNDASHFPVDPRPVITEAEMHGWNERLRLTPRDLTAALMGDPLPGFSALERR